jgi:carbamoyl-phosphate synthase large subunit
VEEYDTQVLKIAQAMCDNNPGLKGAFNIQSIANQNGEVVPFEINCRISGTNSIRSGFGFKDVQYTIEELLWNKEPLKPLITKGVAYRILTDVIYTDVESLKGNNTDKFILF